MAPEKKYTVKQLQDWAKIYKGVLLSKEYTGYKKHYTWRCEKRHVFDLYLPAFAQGAWCSQCAKAEAKVEALELMQSWAEKKGGTCISEKYVSCSAPLWWKCKNGHTFKLSRDAVKQGAWCTACKREIHAEKKLDQMRKLARAKQGVCLADRYVNDATKLLWRCKQGHEWMATPHIIVYDKAWCPHCYGNVTLTLDHMHRLAAKRGGKCLSKKYQNSFTKLKWKCAEGHVWETPPTNIQSGNWCPACAGKKKHTIEDAQKLAKKHGGKCLSKVYINNSLPLKWQCKNKHTWEGTIRSVIIKINFCPRCKRLPARRSR